MSTNPYDSPHLASGDTDHSVGSPAKGRRLLTGCFVIGVGLLIVALFLPARRGVRPAGYRNQCVNNLKQITIALRNYEAAFGALPPAYTVDAEGNRLHSWRTLILPYLGEKGIYDMIDLSKPWDDPANVKARDMFIHAYTCARVGRDRNLTAYLAVVGPDCVFSGDVRRRISEVTDDEDLTLTVIEVNEDQAIHWMSPHDADVETVIRPRPDAEANHPGFVLLGFLSGRAMSLPRSDVDEDQLRAMTTIAGGETINLD